MDVTITRSNTLISRSSLRPFCWVYDAFQADGKPLPHPQHPKLQLGGNRDLAELKRVVKRHYPDARFHLAWKQ